MSAVVFLNATTRDRHDFDEMRAGLSVPSVAIDLPGHGDGPRLPHYSVVAMADALELPEGRPVLYGHSLGGCVAVALAARRPGAVRALVVEDPPLFAFSPERQARGAFYRGFVKLKEQMEGPFAAYGIDEWAQEVANWGSGHGRVSMLEKFGPDAVRRRARQLATFDPEVLGALIDVSIGEGFDPAEDLRAIDVPVTVIAGDSERSSVLSPEDVRRLDAEFGARVVQIEGEGHFIHEVRPAPCLAAIEASLAAP